MFVEFMAGLVFTALGLWTLAEAVGAHREWRRRNRRGGRLARLLMVNGGLK